MDETARPQVGVGVLLVKDGHILLGKRLVSHGTGEYSLPGGHLELGESIEACALRELAEEAGGDLVVTEPKLLCVTNLRQYTPRHYLDIGMFVEWIAGEPVHAEPHKKEPWQWYPPDSLPTPVFGCLHNYLEAYKTGRTYFTE
jgi:8-oxo-dGTP diphosphatase